MLYPKIGIRPTIDGRWGGVRESLEAQTMAMAENAKKLIEENLRYPDGTPVQCVIADSTIGGGAEAAIALAIPLGALGTAMHNFTMTVNSYWVHQGDKCAEQGNVSGIARNNLCGTILHLAERVTVVTIACYFGAPAAEAILNALPPIVLQFLQVAGKMLPALGFALLLKQIVAEKWMIVLFLMGWIITQATGMTTTALTIMAVGVALLFVMAKYNGAGAGASTDEGGDYDE